jgi:hypothetical protein
MRTAHELALATHAIANAICDGEFPNPLNHAYLAINLAAARPLDLVEAEILRRDRDGSRPLAEVEALLTATWPEFLAPRIAPIGKPSSIAKRQHPPFTQAAEAHIQAFGNLTLI